MFHYLFKVIIAHPLVTRRIYCSDFRILCISSFIFRDLRFPLKHARCLRSTTSTISFILTEPTALSLTSLLTSAVLHLSLLFLGYFCFVLRSRGRRSTTSLVNRDAHLSTLKLADVAIALLARSLILLLRFVLPLNLPLNSVTTFPLLLRLFGSMIASGCRSAASLGDSNANLSTVAPALVSLLTTVGVRGFGRIRTVAIYGVAGLAAPVILSVYLLLLLISLPPIGLLDLLLAANRLQVPQLIRYFLARLLQHLYQVLHDLGVLLGDKRVSDTLRTGTTGPPDPMNVVLDFRGV